jgi:hypothetical protein
MMPDQSFSVERRQQVNEASLAVDRIFTDSDLEVTMKSLYVRMIFPVSIDIQSPVAAGSRENIGSRIDATSLRSTNHPDKTIPYDQV